MFFSNIFSLASRSLDVLTGLLDQLEEEELAAEAQEEGFAEDDGWEKIYHHYYIYFFQLSGTWLILVSALMSRMNNCNGHILAIPHRSEPVAPGEQIQELQKDLSCHFFPPGIAKKYLSCQLFPPGWISRNSKIKNYLVNVFSGWGIDTGKGWGKNTGMALSAHMESTKEKTHGEH